MIPLVKLKQDVTFNTDFTKVVDVMKGIATARFFVLQRQLALFEPLSQAAESMLQMVDLSQVEHPFVQPQNDRTGVVMITSDAGFLGGLNSQIVSAGIQAGKGRSGLYTVVGERGVQAFRLSGLDADAFPGVQDDNRGPLASALRDHAVRQMLQGECGRLVVAYARPVSFSVQEVVVRTLCPCTDWVKPPKGMPADERPLLWESAQANVVEYVLYIWLKHQFEEMFSLSRLSEMGARATHLEGSYQELQRRGKHLKLQYQRVRHEVIDRSIREVFSSQLLFSRQKEQARLDLLKQAGAAPLAAAAATGGRGSIKLNRDEDNGEDR